MTDDNPNAPGKDRILYVDDDPALLDVGKIFLERDGTYTVSTCLSAGEALDLLKTTCYDAIVSDYQMPEMDGIGFLKTLRSQGDNTPFIIFTGKGREEVVIEAFDSGADFYLQKGGEPVAQFTELDHKIRHAVSRRRADLALKKSERHYRHLIEHANEAIYIVQDGLIRMTNPRLVEVSGYPTEELLGKPFLQFVHPDDRGMLKSRFKRRVSGETDVPSRYPFRMYRKDGGLIWVELSAVAISWEENPATLNFLTDITDRMHTENALRESEERYRIVTQSITDIVWDCDLQTGSLQWFGDIESIPGYSPGTFPHTLEAWKRVIHPDDRDRVCDALDRSLASGEPFDEDYRVQTPNGTERYWRDRAAMISGPEGTAARMIGAITDVTERRKTQILLKESEERYRLYFRTARDSVFMTTPEGRYIDFNDRLMEKFGCSSREEMLAIDVASTYANPEERQTFLEIARREGYLKEYPIRFRIRNGTVINTLTSIVPMKNPDGSVRAFIGTIRDITDSTRTKRALQESKAQLRTLIDTLPDLIWLKDPNGKYLFCNRRFERFFGASENEIVDKTDADFMKSETAEFFRRYDLAAIASGGPTTNEEEIRFADDGHRELLETIKTPVYGSDGKLVGVLGISRDITERKRGEAALMRANKKLSLLSGITRHDIRNQLTILKGYLAIMKKLPPDTPPDEYFLKINTAVQRIDSMIQFTKDYEQIGTAVPTWQDLHTLVKSAANLAATTKIPVINDIPPGTEVYADPLIIKVLYNLIDNAVRYGGKITTIRFSAQERTDTVILVCEDDGDGIPVPEKERIFGLGYGRNTGLGLALSREILAITGITIAEDGTPGSGARFEMVLPREAGRFVACGTKP